MDDLNMHVSDSDQDLMWKKYIYNKHSFDIVTTVASISNNRNQELGLLYIEQWGQGLYNL